MATEVVTGRAGWAKRAAAALLADERALAEYDIGAEVPADVATALEAMRPRRRGDHTADHVHLLREGDE